MERLLNPRETAERLGLAEQTLAVWRMTGRGPMFRKIGARVKYKSQDIDAFIEASARRSTSDRGEGAGVATVARP